MKEYLQMKGVTKRFPGVLALVNVDFNVNEGEVVALVGENGAGKSTLMNILGGLIPTDSGEVVINGNTVSIKSASDAQKNGIAFIHQELSLFRQLNVQENLFIDNLPGFKIGMGLLNVKKLHDSSKIALEQVGVDLPLNAKISDLTIGQQQMVEIASALIKNAKIIILDEPTTSLTLKECDKLFTLIRRFKDEGRLIIYISHDIDSALNISDRIYVLKDGKNSGEALSAEVEKVDIVNMMIGRESGKMFYKSKRDRVNEVILSVKDLNDGNKLSDVTIDARKGEVLGFYGLIGSGRTELIQAIYGMNPIKSGEVSVKGQVIKKPKPALMKSLGIGYLTENRKDEGLFLELPINHNMTITSLDKIKRKFFGLIDRKKDHAITNEIIDQLRVMTPGIWQLVGKLSGGNQQKIVIGKWLQIKPEVFFLDEPTKGIDVGAKSEVYRIIDQLACDGICIIMISSEVEEIIGMCDRVFIMSKGQIVAELTGEHINENEIIKHAMGVGI